MTHRRDRQIELLADASNRSIVALLDEATQPLHVESLAERLVSDDVTIVDTPEYEAQLEKTLLTLHHEHLPRLDEAGLLEYDRERNVITDPADPTPDIEREDEPVSEALTEYLPPTHEADGEGVGVINGREAVIQYGRQLADEAEEELFCMYVDTDLLREECIRRAQNAIDRGVTMYLGSQDPEVRELTRTQLPEATIWEPQLDWLNTPGYPRVGRLVLIDRRKVMLAVLEEPTDEPASDETAIVGDGVDHPLVVLTRELLGARLDHLDYQSGDHRRQLPSD